MLIAVALTVINYISVQHLVKVGNSYEKVEFENQLVPEKDENGNWYFTTAVARMVALSAIAAVLTTFVMGALSDKLKNRRLFISVGYILWGIVTRSIARKTPKSRVAISEPEVIELCPYGCARLRMTEMPVLGKTL